MLSPKQKVATKSLSRRSESYQYSKIKSATVRGVSENLRFPNKRSLFEKKIRETAITKTNWGQNTLGILFIKNSMTIFKIVSQATLYFLDKLYN